MVAVSREHNTKHHKSLTMAVYTHYNTQYHQCNGCCSKTRSEFDDLEGDDLLFEMEDEELGKSYVSVCMKCSAGSPDIPGRERSRGSIVQHGLERPETLSIATANRMRRDEFYNTQYIKEVNQQPEADFKADNSWDFGLDRAGQYSSVSSVEEARELIPATSKRYDICSSDFIAQEANVEPTTKSPRFLPKFLRSSFSRLISKDKAKMVEPMSLPFFSTISISNTSSPTWSVDDNDSQQPTDTPDTKESLTCSPNTRKFVEESLAKGLPLIPFNYSSADIVEKRRAERINKVFFPVSSSSQHDGLAGHSHTAVSSSPARTKYRKLNPCLKYSVDNMEDKSLEGLVCLAKKEMEEESIQKKVQIIIQAIPFNLSNLS